MGPRRGPAWLRQLPRPIRSGHRGAAGLVEANTLASYERAIALGCDLIEVDVQLTADGALVLFHDDEVVVHGRKQAIAHLTLAELRAIPLVAGGQVPTLAAALDCIGGRAIPLLDLKGVGFERDLAGVVRDAGVERAIVCGRPLASLLAIHDHNAAIATSLTFSARALRELDAAGVVAVPTDAVTVDYRTLTPGLLRRFQEQGISVIAWTVDEPATMRELIRWGIDGITTNRPDLLAAITPRGGDGTLGA